MEILKTSCPKNASDSQNLCVQKSHFPRKFLALKFCKSKNVNEYELSSLKLCTFCLEEVNIPEEDVKSAKISNVIYYIWGWCLKGKIYLRKLSTLIYTSVCGWNGEDL